MCKPDMLETANVYLQNHKFYDYQINSTYGIDAESVEMARQTEGVEKVEAAIEKDIIMQTSDGCLSLMKAFNMPSDLNTLNLVKGRFPTKSDECAVDNSSLADGNYKIGDKIMVAEVNDEDDADAFKVKEFTITAYVNSPLFLDYERGTASIGNGSVDAFFYVPIGALDHEYYTQMYIKLDGDEYIFSNELEAKISGAEDRMEDLAKLVTADRRERERAKAQEELDDNAADYRDGLKKYNDGLAQYKDGLKKYNDQKKSTEQQLTAAQKDIDNGSAQLAASRQQAESALSELTDTKTTADSLAQSIAQLETLIPFIPDGPEKETMKQQLLQAQAGLQAIKDGLAEKGMSIEMLEPAIEETKAGLEVIASKEAELAKGQAELNTNKEQADKGFKKAKAELDAANKTLIDSKKKLDDAKGKIDDAQEEIDTLEEGDSYSLSRENNIGYSTFEQNANIVANIAKIFPAFFFLVAALVCMTTMTRMMEDQRSQVGILKALGYSNRAIMSKYMFYSGSAATIGAVIGFFAGCNIFPKVIWNAYTMMYDFNSNVEFKFDVLLGLECLGVALLCSMGATWASCAQDFGVAPAQLIRPKTPKAGKRILLERITPVWNRISFLYKVTFRNIFRYKKRFLMMVIGIAGCTALLIAGFGINTTIKGVAKFQYDEVSLYDYQIVFDQDMTDSDQADFIEYATNEMQEPGSFLFVNSSSCDMTANGKKGEIDVIATDDPVDKFVNLHYKGKTVPYPGDGEIVICQKLNRQYGIDVGDTISIQQDYDEMTAKVVGIFDNYVGTTAFMTAKTYEAGFGKPAEKKTAYVLDPAEDRETIHENAAHLGAYEHSAATIVNNDMLDRVDSMMKSLNAVIYVVILCAGLLAFIVLYNLTNINITERIREIATIKVLGFNHKETGSYVFRENIFLTAFGAICGIPLGKWLLDFVIDNINVNMIFFATRITWQNYLYSILLTFAFALIVNLAMQPVLHRVSMTESLKSIE